MSHDCPRCDQWCYCDGEDSPSRTAAWVARHCAHDCAELHDEDDEGSHDGWFHACSDTCDGPGPDIIDQDAEPERAVDLPCPKCGRRESPVGAALAHADPARDGSQPADACVRCGERECHGTCRPCDRADRAARRGRSRLRPDAPAWVVLRHGGRSSDRWRVVCRVAAEERARGTYQRLHEALRQGGLRLLAPDGAIALEGWAPRLRTRW